MLLEKRRAYLRRQRIRTLIRCIAGTPILRQRCSNHFDVLGFAAGIHTVLITLSWLFTRP